MFHFKVFIKFLVESNIFIGLCAALLALSSLWFHLNIHYIGFVFFGTITAYLLLRRPEEFFKLKRHIKTKLTLALTGALTLLFFGISDFTWPIPVFLILATVLFLIYGLGVWTENKILTFRNYGVVKLLTIAAVWTLITCMIPKVYTNTSLDLAMYIPYYFQRFIFIIMLTIPFDMKDSVREKALGHKSLPAIMGNAFALKLCKGLALVYWVSSGFLGIGYLIAGSIVVLLYLFWLNKLEKCKSIESFTLRFDGLMIIEALLVILSAIVLS